ncbi:hypothetical protein P3T76_014857 [Phytophthora citrophthora]|uniref:Tc1-like transposase DDE domain-containing protein n=1 Tax=Phytophthora citrophthora TaxID=4793 RepID=A0AAD9G0L5_9STRA|nr:hypothetical protein P3T76_014857 [Phytophthora citrophthora]
MGSLSMQDSSEDVEAVVATSTSRDDTARTKHRHHYSVKLKRQVLTALDTEQLSLRVASRKFGVPRRTASNWVKEKRNIFSIKGSEKTLARTTGTPELIPFSTQLVTYMKDIRRTNQPLTTTKMAHYIKTEHLHWIAAYTATKVREDAAYESLLRLMRRFAYRHGFSRRRPHGLKEKQDDLNEVQKAFSCKYDELYRQYDPSAVFNIDETGVYYDTPPSCILCERGKSAAITTPEKHSARLTVVCSVREDGQKLPLFFILRGAPGGCIETTELPTYPKGPSVLLVDNLDSHVSQESVDIVAGELFSTLQPLPKNSTSVCQPLDVGVMGPLKAKLRTAWLLEDTVCKTAKEKWLATIQRVILAWESISDDTIFDWPLVSVRLCIVRFTLELSTIKWCQMNIQFLDEVSFENRGMLRSRGYSLKGKKLAFRGEFNRKARVSLLCFISVDGHVETFHTDGTFDRSKFVECYRTHAHSENTVHQYPGRGSVWILDGAKIHCHPDIVYYLRSLGIIIPIFLPAYCPFYNPIEYLFGLIKKAFKRQYVEGSKENTLCACAAAVSRV